jgi:hypothetical protein
MILSNTLHQLLLLATALSTATKRKMNKAPGKNLFSEFFPNNGKLNQGKIIKASKYILFLFIVDIPFLFFRISYMELFYAIGDCHCHAKSNSSKLVWFFLKNWITKER